jgi:hypothetical protein
MFHVLKTADPWLSSGSAGAVVLALLAATGLGTCPAAAQEPASAERFEPGFYAGAELGEMRYGTACSPTALSCDHADSVYAVYGGYRLGRRFMLEVGKRDLGEALAVYPRLTSTIDVVGEVDGYEFSALLRLPFGRAWEAYVRAGGYHWDAATASSEFSTAESDWSPSAGAGFAWQFRPAWQARFQFLYLGDVGGTETGEANVEMLSAGVSYLFGGRRATDASAEAAASTAPAAPQ